MSDYSKAASLLEGNSTQARAGAQIKMPPPNDARTASRGSARNTARKGSR